MSSRVLYSILLLLMLMSASLPTSARDFKYTYQGQTLTYTVLDEAVKTCMTRAGDSYAGNTITGELQIPDVVKDGDNEYTVTTIGKDAFFHDSGLTSVTIPSSVTSIGSRAFCGCESLTAVTIPISVTTIDSDAFNRCYGLTQVIIPNSVTSIGSGAFSQCENLASVTIGNSVTEISNDAFSYCRSLASVTIPKSVTSIGSDAFRCCYGLTNVTIPNSVTSIGSGAFCGCESLTAVTIPNSVTSIGSDAFTGCDRLRIITLEDQIPPEIAGNVFSNNSYLKIYIPDGSINTYLRFWGRYKDYFIEGIPAHDPFTIVDNVFYAEISDGKAYAQSASRQIEKADIASEVSINGEKYMVTSIPERGFYNCPVLTSVFIPNSVTSIDEQAFQDCIGLTSVTIPESITEIGVSVFWGCSSLTSVIIPNSVTSIATQAFAECSSLTSVVIPNSVTSIGKYAFSKCNKLDEISVLAPAPPMAYSSDTFYGVNRRNCILYVPKESVSAYEQAAVWKEFYQIVGKDFSGINDVETDGDAAGEIDFDAPMEVYSPQGILKGYSLDNSAPGIYIVRQGNIVKKYMVK